MPIMEVYILLAALLRSVAKILVGSVSPEEETKLCKNIEENKIKNKRTNLHWVDHQ